ncbi:uncharacterized protein NPIL_414401, partial [Nephila pilipes]
MGERTLARAVRCNVNLLMIATILPENSVLRQLKVGKRIIYLDVNNLYGWAMFQALTYGDFKWISPDAFNKERILSIDENSEIDYIFEVDLEFLVELHNLHSDYPLEPEKMLIKEHMISPTSR